MYAAGAAMGWLGCWLIMRARVQRVIAALQELARLRSALHTEFMERSEREIKELEAMLNKETR
jgi:hypothetical protein